MGRSPWTFHAACLRGEIIAVPAGPHEVLLTLRTAFDLVGPEPGQVLRLVPGAIVFSEVNEAARERLAVHLNGPCASSAFRVGLGLMLGMEMSDHGQAVIDEWIDAHLAVVLLPVPNPRGGRLPACRYGGLLNGLFVAEGT